MTQHLTPEQVADRWQRPVSWVRQQAKASAIPAMKLGHTWRFDLADIERYEARHKTADPLSMTPLSRQRQKSA